MLYLWKKNTSWEIVVSNKEAFERSKTTHLRRERIGMD
jgi:hypothetical protein